MPQVEISVGGRHFEVACQPGEEPYLRSAAALLDAEASALSEQIGRMPEGRMLLMAGLMLADKTASLEDRLRQAEARVAALESAARTRPPEVEVPVEVRVVPPEAIRLMESAAEEAEALARALAEIAGAAPPAPAPG
ncbi:cell division protein ZapA [Rubellimicrobium sp. CFH 75288]|uniref:cell division protein ZapA n=1 Tax=Rubellimicrobium sp. CFH 75288 TaxID=2697034 RepID=UPI001411D6F3|nr:cell division protein ZapA [Rubellimicrobium sp. CFH 75288]NAZ36037.1 cell division protein ZapA [Rubellimicrobium sp. CFH 75288]